MAQIGIPIGHGGGALRPAGRQIAPGIGANISANPFGKRIIDRPGATGRNALLEVSQGHLLGRAGERQIFEPGLAHIRRAEVEPMILGDQQAQQGIHGIVIHGHAAHLIARECLARGILIAQGFGFRHIAPIIPQR